MKILLLGLAGLTLAFASAAQSGENSSDTSARADSQRTDAQGAKAGMHTDGQRAHAVRTATQGADKRSGSPAGAITTSDFLRKAAMSGMAEVELGQLASRQGSSSAVREYGQQMVADHTRANTELKALAGKHNQDLPTELDAEHAAIRNRLQDLNGVAFDRSYADVMVANHGKAVSLFESGANLDQSEIAEFAQNKLPTLRLHESHAERLRTAQ